MRNMQVKHRLLFLAKSIRRIGFRRHGNFCHKDPLASDDANKKESLYLKLILKDNLPQQADEDQEEI